MVRHQLDCHGKVERENFDILLSILGYKNLREQFEEEDADLVML